MIKSFRHKGIEKFFTTGSTAGIRKDHTKKLQIQLTALHRAKRPEDMSAPGWKLHPLKGGLKGHWSIWVSGNYRLTFAFEGEDAILVDYQDYHQETHMARMHNPAHPGEVLREYLGDTSVTEAASRLGVTRVALSRILNGANGISADMALRLEASLGTSAEMWTGMQSDYELWQASQQPRPKIRRMVHAHS